MVCHGERRFERRAERVRKIGGPSLLPLGKISSVQGLEDSAGQTLGDTKTRMIPQQRLGFSEIGPMAAQGHGLR